MKPLLTTTILVFCTFIYNTLQAQEERLTAIADSLHRTFISIDTHNDASIGINYPNRTSSIKRGQVSFPLMKQGGLDVAFFAAFVEQGPRTPQGHQNAFRDADFQLNGLKAYAQAHAHEAEIAYHSTDMRRIKKEGRSVMVLAIENGYCIGNDIEKLRHFSALGVRMVTLCHNGNNDICDASRDNLEHGGLSPFGREVVKEMNRLGMMIDVSHASKAATLEAVAISSHPVMASHSGVRAIKNNVRNLSDEEMLAIAAKGGLIQVATGSFFLADLPAAEVTVKHIVDHVDYVVKLVGVEHVGLGSDFDGGGGVSDCDTMGEMKKITVELLRRGYTHNQIAMIWGGNVIRMMDRVQNERLMAIADSLHRTFISIDTHNDASLRINNPNRPQSPNRRELVTFPLMKQGWLDVAFHAAFVGQGPRTPEGHQNAFENVDNQIKGLKAYVQANDKEAAIAYNTKDMRRIKSEGKSILAISIENGYCIGTDLAKIAYFSSMGVQMMTICHSRNNEICDSANDTLQFGGLSPFGREVVKEMNRLGMIIDVSHASKATTLQVIALSNAPIMASHSGAYGIRQNLRNLSDEEIKAMAAKGGVVQVVFLANYLSTLPRAEVTVKDIVDHIDYIAKLVGVEYVGIGTDFEGGGGVADCPDVGGMKQITVELLRRGYTHSQIAMIWGGNTMRLIDRVQGL